MEAGLGHSSENLAVLRKEQFKASPEFSGHTLGLPYAILFSGAVGQI